MTAEVVPVELELTATSLDVGQTVTKCVNLHRAAMKGDWKSAIDMKASLTRQITDKDETALHIAAGFKQHNFVKELLNYVKNLRPAEPEALKSFLETRNSSGNTALSYAALTEEVEIARLMVETYRDSVLDHDDQLSPGLPYQGTIKPVLVATSLGHKKMVEYLLANTRLQELSRNDHHELFVGIICMGLYDKALEILEENPNLAVAYPDCDIALHVLARMPSAFVQKDLPFWRKCRNFCTKVNNTGNAEQSDVIKLVNKLIETELEDIEADVDPNTVIAQALLLAAEEGNTELVIHLLQSDPGLVWRLHPGNRSIFHIAIEKRHESIFTLIHEFGAMKDLIAKNEVEGGNNMLHLAAQLAPQAKLNEVSGAALQMQRELFWFKEVEKIVQPSLRHNKNIYGQTPHVLFNERHKDLRHAGEKWLKDAAKSGMLVATLIATGTFAAFFSVPGGYDNHSGMPSRQNDRCFSIFSFSNSVAWFSAATSTIMFAFILTSRYAEEDFLYSLPSKLTLGVSSLLVSIGSMMVTFCATFLLYYPRNFGWLIGFLVVFPLLPLAYVSVMYPLLFDLIFSAYRSRLMFVWPKRLL